MPSGSFREKKGSRNISMVSIHPCNPPDRKSRRLLGSFMLLAWVFVPSFGIAQNAGPTQNEKARGAASNKESRQSSAAGSDQQIQFNQAGILGGDASFVFNYTNKLIGVGPQTTSYLPSSSTPTTLPTLQISTDIPFLFQPGFQPVFGGGEVLYTGLGWSSTFTDYAPPYGSATKGMDVPLNIFKGYAPTIDPSNAYIVGANILFQTDPAYIGDSSGSFLSPLALTATIQSPAHFGQVYGLNMQAGASLQDGETVTIDDLRKVYLETLLGAGPGHTATYNIGKLVGLNLATQGFHGPQNGKITTSWSLNI